MAKVAQPRPGSPVAIKNPGRLPFPIGRHIWGQLAKRYVHSDAIEIGRIALSHIAGDRADDGALVEVLQAAWAAFDKPQFFRSVASQNGSGRPIAVGYWARSALRAISIEEAGTEFILGWVRRPENQRAYCGGCSLGSHHPFPSFRGRLLEEFAEIGVGSAFRSSFMSGGFVGPHSQWSREKLEQAKACAADERPTVRHWGASLIDSLEDDIRRAEAREAEDRFY